MHPYRALHEPLPILIHPGDLQVGDVVDSGGRRLVLVNEPLVCHSGVSPFDQLELTVEVEARPLEGGPTTVHRWPAGRSAIVAVSRRGA